MSEEEKEGKKEEEKVKRRRGSREIGEEGERCYRCVL